MVVDEKTEVQIQNFKKILENFKKSFIAVYEAWDEQGCEVNDIIQGVIDKEQFPFFNASFDELGIDNFCDSVSEALEPHKANMTLGFNLMSGAVSVVAELVHMAEVVDEGNWPSQFSQNLKSFFEAVFPIALERNSANTHWSDSDEKALKSIFAMAKAMA